MHPQPIVELKLVVNNKRPRRSLDRSDLIDPMSSAQSLALFLKLPAEWRKRKMIDRFKEVAGDESQPATSRQRAQEYLRKVEMLEKAIERLKAEEPTQ